LVLKIEKVTILCKMNISALIYFFAFNFIVTIISWRKLRREKDETSESFFLGKRNLSFVYVGSLLILSNINGIQFIGENESVYTNNMSVMAWGMTSVVAMLIVSEFFMPIYLRSGIITTPDFLEERYDASTKKFVSIIFLVSYVINMLPTVLYGGAVIFNGLFDFSEIFKISHFSMMCILVCFFGSAGLIYTIVGGIKVIALSDMLLGIGLLIGGLFLPYFGLKFLGNGGFFDGLNIILSSKTEHFNAIGSKFDPIPFSTLFTGMLLVNLNYWGMEQFIVQRTLASKNLAESQKGIALASLGKLLSPLIINLPGIIAVHLYPKMTNTAEIFPRLAGDVLPSVLIGLIAAVIFGATITSFNAGLNSISTLFVLNIYQPNKTGNVTEKKLIKQGKHFMILAAIIALIIAPFLMYAKGGFYTYLQKVGGAFSVPIFTILIVGFLTKRVPPIAAKIGLCFFVTCYLLSQFVLNLNLHYLHVLAILFTVTVILMLAIGRIRPMPEPYVQRDNHKVNLDPWKNRHIYGILIILAMIFIFIFFSKYGIVKS
jgi:solute:Na+ symporter, SSS family